MNILHNRGLAIATSYIHLFDIGEYTLKGAFLPLTKLIILQLNYIEKCSFWKFIPADKSTGLSFHEFGKIVFYKKGDKTIVGMAKPTDLIKLVEPSANNIAKKIKDELKTVIEKTV